MSIVNVCLSCSCLKQNWTWVEVLTTSTSTHAPKKKVRGPTKKKAIWNLKSHEKVVVTFNELVQPIRDKANELTKFLGTLMRMSQHIGIQYEEWRKVPDVKKEDLWSIVKVEAENKKRNRSKSDEPHITGSKSFARLCDEETQKNDGVPPSRGGMYCLTRTYKDGRIVNAKAAKVVEAIKTMGESSTAQETRTDGSPYWIDDDLAKVKGPERGGNVRCVGKFPAAKKRRVQDPQVPVLKAEVKGIREDLMRLVAAVKEHIPGLNLSTIISRANTNMEGDDACNVRDNSLVHNPKNSRSTGASHHPKNSTSTATSAHLKNSRSTATSPHPKNPTSGMSSHPKNPTFGKNPKNPTSGTSSYPKNPTSGKNLTSGPGGQCYYSVATSEFEYSTFVGQQYPKRVLTHSVSYKAEAIRPLMNVLQSLTPRGVNSLKFISD
ncbi:transposase, Ptta/En/Spm [Tanacetum coccineum]